MFKNYSVVMPVYHKDEPEWLRLAIDSMLNQSVISNDIIIVADGPLTRSLDSILENYINLSNISIFRLSKNQGLGCALNFGIAKSMNELIARMDADDISIKNRCELQLREFNCDATLDIYGGQIAEFTDAPEIITSFRKVPTSHDKIRLFSRRRNPFNHPTVMFKKSQIIKIGGYDPSATRLEDYDLWLRGLSYGMICRNSSKVLLKYRSNIKAINRRKTVDSFMSHIKFRIQFFKKRYISLSDLIIGLLAQLVLFILPSKLASNLIKKVVRNEKL